MVSSANRKPEGYDEFLVELKKNVQQTQLDAAQAVGRCLIPMYWRIGRSILERQERLGWGAKVIDRVAMDLRRSFPEVRGFSGRNLKYMRGFALAWPDEAVVQQLLHKLPWGHLVRLLDKVGEPRRRLWYAKRAIENGWSRNVLVVHIERGLYEAQGSASTNFDSTLPVPQSDLARDTLKDPYKIGFLGIAEDAEERVIERGLVRHIRDFLIELGQGFSFVGNQFPLQVGNDDFRIDLLFYHLKLRCFVVIELKAGKFKPEHMGKLNFYLSAVDDLLRHPDDQPSIGMVLCKDRSSIVAEYALRGTSQPMAVSQYELTKSLPERLKGKLPSVDDLEAAFDCGR